MALKPAVVFEEIQPLRGDPGVPDFHVSVDQRAVDELVLLEVDEICVNVGMVPEGRLGELGACRIGIPTETYTTERNA